MAGRICPGTNCPSIIPPGTPRCPPCTKTHEAKRGTTSQRGYGTPHQKARTTWAARLALAGQLPCVRCGKPIMGGQPFHLDHDDTRKGYRGPAHPHCNLSAAGKHAAKLQEQTRNGH